MGWWNEISTTEQVLYILAAASTIILLIQTVLAMFGLDSDAGELDPDAKGFRVFTVRGCLSFFAIASWVTIVLFKATANWPIAFCVGAAAGVATMLLVAKGFLLVRKFQNAGNVDLTKAVGAKGEVYATIPPQGEGTGRVSVAVQGRIRVYDAIAYEDKKIPTGSDVRILNVAGANVLLVESLPEPSVSVK